jgi:hypothetical protein
MLRIHHGGDRVKVGDLVEWIYDKDIGIVTKTVEPQQVWIEWVSGADSIWMWDDTQGLKLIQKSP